MLGPEICTAAALIPTKQSRKDGSAMVDARFLQTETEANDKVRRGAIIFLSIC